MDGSKPSFTQLRKFSNLHAFRNWLGTERWSYAAACLLLGTTLTACSTLPSEGPHNRAFDTETGFVENTASPISLVNIDQNVVAKLGTAPASSVYSRLNVTSTKPSVLARVGDAIAIRIWEAHPDGLFSASGEDSNIIAATVSRDGDIFVPYAGDIGVTGLSEKQIRARILDELSGKASDPQIQVNIKSSPANSVSITGGVSRPGQYPLQSGELELLDAISVAGGTHTPKHETRISLLRNGKTYELMLSDVFADPRNNVPIRPGDVLELSHLPRTYTTFGAVRTSGQVEFPAETVTLEQALARAGGLNGITANNKSVFLFRFESSNRLASAGQKHTQSKTTPAIYRIDMSSPSAFFWARGFEIQDNDVLYVATAPAAELSKFLSMIVNPLLGNAASVNVIASE
nr:polysaccharide biosynthesis/export family protein [Shimia sp. R11_0]